jgi:glyoxylase I family protein
MLHLTAIHHVAIICRDYETSKHFYTKTLGLTVVREVYRAERESYKLDLALNGQYVIELFSFPNPPPRSTRPEALGLRHLAFEVSDLDAAVAYLHDQGIPYQPNQSVLMRTRAAGLHFLTTRTACRWNFMRRNKSTR